MINRVLIRIKAVQLLYAFCSSEGKTLVGAEKEFFLSLKKSYELYHYLLFLIIELTSYAKERSEKKKNLVKNKDLSAERFINNLFVKELSENVTLSKFISDEAFSWKESPEFLKQLYSELIQSDVYLEYVSKKEPNTFIEDKEFWRKLLKKVVFSSEVLVAELEERCIYWNDDLELVSSFVFKTVKKYEEGNPQQALLPMFKDEEDEQYAKELFVKTIENQAEYRKIIENHIQNWEVDRLALMDMVIMQAALTELMNFPLIPTNVTLNEYIEIAKYYSTERSGVFINGILDSIVGKLNNENKLLKVVRIV